MQKCKWIGLVLYFWISTAFAAVTLIPSYQQQQYDQAITQLLQKESWIGNTQTRLLAYSQAFLNQPYVLFPNGEGVNADIDQGPLYRTDVFDCMTYVTTVVALSLSKNFAQFHQTYLLMNYKNKNINFFTRNHFTSSDYNINNNKNGILRDVTRQIVGRDRQPLYITQLATVNKSGWLTHLSPSRIRLLQAISPKQEQALRAKLYQQAARMQSDTVKVDYIPLSALFSSTGQANLFAFDQIQNGAIIEIVRPVSKNEQALLATNLNISHMGFVIHSRQGLMFREASTVYGRVVDVPLISYLRAYAEHEPQDGIHLEQVRGC